MQRPCALLCLAAAVSAFQPPAARSLQLTQMYGFDNPASRPKCDLSVQPSNGTAARTVSCTIFDTRRCRVVTATAHSLSHYAIDHTRRRRGGHEHAVDRRSNKDAYKPALGSRVDDTLSTIPQKGPSLDMGSAKMVGFYGVLAAAVAAALAFQG